MDLFGACRFKGGSDATSWELMPKCHSKLTLLAEPQGKTPENWTKPRLHVCQPCRDGVTTRSELTISISNAGEFEEARCPGRTLVVHPNKQRWEKSQGPQGERDRLY